jgi:hypothetical protein
VTEADLLSVASDLRVEVRALRAVLDVETHGEALLDGRPVVRLEVNHLWLLVERGLRPVIDARFRVLGPQPWAGHMWRPIPDGEWTRLHQPGPAGQRLEWAALTLARSISEVAAVEATSWGLGQVLGEHWSELGYPHLDAFVEAQSTEIGQLGTFARFLSWSGAVESLRSLDWLSFARVYNGRGKAAQYARELAAAYRDL